MRLVSRDLITSLKLYDPTIDLLYNPRISRWIVVQDTKRTQVIDHRLRGCPTIQGERTTIKPLLVCEVGELPSNPERGIPVEPNYQAIIAMLEQFYPVRGREVREHEEGTDPYSRREAKNLDAARRKHRSVTDHIEQESNRDFKKYGQNGRWKKHFTLTDVGAQHGSSDSTG